MLKNLASEWYIDNHMQLKNKAEPTVSRITEIDIGIIIWDINLAITHQLEQTNRTDKAN